MEKPNYLEKVEEDAIKFIELQHEYESSFELLKANLGNSQIFSDILGALMNRGREPFFFVAFYDFSDQKDLDRLKQAVSKEIYSKVVTFVQRNGSLIPYLQDYYRRKVEGIENRFESSWSTVELNLMDDEVITTLDLISETGNVLRIRDNPFEFVWLSNSMLNAASKALKAMVDKNIKIESSEKGSIQETLKDLQKAATSIKNSLKSLQER